MSGTTVKFAHPGGRSTPVRSVGDGVPECGLCLCKRSTPGQDSVPNCHLHHLPCQDFGAPSFR